MSTRVIASVAVVCLFAGVFLAVHQSDPESVENIPETPVETSVETAEAYTNTDGNPLLDTADGSSSPEGVTIDQLRSELADSGYETIREVLKQHAERNHETPEPALQSAERQLPTFALTALDNTQWSAATLKGKPWVINFWATWCPPCIEELPSMNAAFGILEPEGVGMLAINAGEGAAAVAAFLEKVAIDFPNVLGDGDTLPNWSVRALPTTIVIDAQGNVVYEAIGPREWDDPRLIHKVLQLL